MAQIDPKTPVGELVRERPSRARLFESLGIEYCCGGKAGLDEACLGLGLNVQEVVERIEESDTQGETGEYVDANAMSLSELADHIVAKHHAYLRAELPRLEAMTKRVAQVHGTSDERLASVHTAFCSVRDELMSHMMKEERILFPRIRQLESSAMSDASGCGSIRGPIQQMEHEHDNAGEALDTMRHLTDDYTPPEWACNTYRAMLDGLETFEADMHQHVHKENNVLFPKAIALEEKVLGVAG